jgi:hypothetical protein
LKKIDENFEKKFAKFSTNGFLVLSKQSRTKQKPDDFLNSEPNPTQTQKNWNSLNINTYYNSI